MNFTKDFHNALFGGFQKSETGYVGSTLYDNAFACLSSCGIYPIYRGITVFHVDGDIYVPVLCKDCFTY